MKIKLSDNFRLGYWILKWEIVKKCIIPYLYDLLQTHIQMAHENKRNFKCSVIFYHSQSQEGTFKLFTQNLNYSCIDISLKSFGRKPGLRKKNWNVVWNFFLTTRFASESFLKYIRKNTSTVKPVYNGQHWDSKKLAVVQKLPLSRGWSWKVTIYFSWLGIRPVVIDRWPLFGGGRCSEVAVNTGLTVLD